MSPLTLIKLVAAGFVAAAPALALAQTPPKPETGYADVNGLHAYYEIHGLPHVSDPPLVLIHGSFMTIESWGELVPALAATREVIAVELQGHGHTADVAGRPFTREQMADDVAALVGQLGRTRVDVYGYSLGGWVALQLALRHPDLVRKVVFVSSSYASAGWVEGMTELMADMTPEMFAGSPFLAAHLAAGGTEEGFASLVRRIVELVQQPFDWTEQAVALTDPMLIVIGDVDNFRPQHAFDLFNALGGDEIDPFGVKLPRVQLAVLPATSHLGILERTPWIAPMVEAFLAAPMPE